MAKIRRSLTRVLTASDDDVAKVTRVLPRQARMFTTKTEVEFNPEPTRGFTVMELDAADRPGLLSKVGQVFLDEGIDIDAAKIMTIGERAEDVFYISSNAGPSALAGKGCHENYFNVAWQNDNLHEAAGAYASGAGFGKSFILAPNYPAGKDALGHEGYRARYGVDNPNLRLLEALRDERPTAIVTSSLYGLWTAEVFIDDAPAPCLIESFQLIP